MKPRSELGAFGIQDAQPQSAPEIKPLTPAAMFKHVCERLICAPSDLSQKLLPTHRRCESCGSSRPQISRSACVKDRIRPAPRCAADRCQHRQAAGERGRPSLGARTGRLPLARSGTWAVGAAQLKTQDSGDLSKQLSLQRFRQSMKKAPARSRGRSCRAPPDGAARFQLTRIGKTHKGGRTAGAHLANCPHQRPAKGPRDYQTPRLVATVNRD